MSPRNCTRLVDAISPFHSVRVINSADRGWCLRAPDSSVRKVRRLYTHYEPRGGDKNRGWKRRRERGQEREREREH